MKYKSIHTNYGKQRMIAAEAGRGAINLVQIAVGDGKGNATTPDENQTQLVREMFRGPVNRITQDPQNPQMFTAEVIIPADVGGFTLREVGIFDADGGLFVVGNLPDTYKPNLTEGSYSDTVLRLQFMAVNAEVVTIKVDPNVVVPSQSWVINNITPAVLFPGGTTGQVLRKKSNASGDTEWGNASDVNVLVSTVEEHQTLAANQTTVDLALTNTLGLAVYVAGQRLPNAVGADGWQPHATVYTRLILGKAYAAGTKIICVQNEPASNLEDPLSQQENLSDVPDKAVARSNLGVYSKAESDRAAPVSEVAYFACKSAPDGWLKANGAAISRQTYAALYEKIGETFGAGDGFTSFNVPDLRGEFIRGLDDGRGLDSDRQLGTVQFGQNASHTHSVTDPGHTHGGGQLVGGITYSGSGGGYLEEGQAAPNYTRAGIESSTTGITLQQSGGTEARPRNVALLACIKY